jgi:hypothetical protein
MHLVQVWSRESEAANAVKCTVNSKRAIAGRIGGMVIWSS